MATLDVSIHAPAWGATGDRPRLPPRPPRFNPRTRVGCDNTLWDISSLTIVSIHAPAWGATAFLPPARLPGWSFNPRTRVGCDLFLGSNILAMLSFNPRTRVGCDAAKPRH